MDPHRPHIGDYSIERELGRGGMGVVFLASDPRLNRQVAIKYLNDAGPQTEDRIARLEREARTLAALNHPNIAAIHGLERDPSGRVYLVLEYVDGETLADRLQRGPMDIDETLEVCAQIAAGAEAAHDCGVVHRDLKPGNVKITTTGKVKVLDFGLAKSEPGATSGAPVPADLSASPTVTEPGHRSGPVTQPGVVMGTAPYMSPEQARGKPIDRRTDIWAFGCILYECLTAKRLFEGETVADIFAAVLEREVDLSRLPARTPPRVRDLLRQCLERDPRRRLKDLGDARLVLERAIEGREWTTTGALAAADERVRGKWGRWTVRAAPWVIAAGALLALLVSRPARPSEPPVPEVRRVTFALPLPSPVPGPIEDYSLMQRLAVSPDGRTLVMAAGRGTRSELIAHDMATGRSAPIEGSIDAAWPVFSPDGRRIAFTALNGELRVIPASGGPPVTICQLGSCRGLVWNDDDVLYFADANTGGSLFQVPARPAQPKALLTPSGTPEDYLYRYPCPTRSGESILYVVAKGGPYNSSEIRATRPGTGESRTVLTNAFDPRFAPDGRLLFSRDEAVYIVDFDERTLSVVGEPRLVLSDCVVDFGPLGVSHYALGRDGTLVYIPGRFERPTNAILWVGMDGRAEPILNVHSASEVRLSRDQRIIGFTRSQPVRGVALYDIERDLVRTIPTPRARAWFGAFDPDGNRFWFLERGPLGDRIMYGWLDDRSPPAPLAIVPGTSGISDISPDGSTLLVWVFGGTERSRIAQVRTDDGSVQPLALGNGRFHGGVFSPDGRWIAYTSNETGAYEIMARRADLSGGRVQVSTRGGQFANWAPDGAAIYYWRIHDDGGTFVRVPVKLGDRIEIGREVDLFESRPEDPIDQIAFDVAEDGSRFLMIERERAAGNYKEARVIVGWLGTLPDPPAGDARQRQ